MATTKTDFPGYLLETFVGDIYGLQNIVTRAPMKKGLKDQKLTAGVKQQLKRLGADLQEEMKLYNETAKELYDKWAKSNPDNPEAPKQVPAEDLPAFQKEATELGETLITLDHYKFTKNDFGYLFDNPIEEDYAILDFLVPLEDEETKDVAKDASAA